MYRNQSVSKFGCKYEINYWCLGYNLPHQVLVSHFKKSVLALLLVLVSSTSIAKQAYYTWVDAQGVIHNTAVASEASQQGSDREPDLKSSPESDSDISTDKIIKGKSEEKANKQAEVISGEVYKTEEELQQEIKSGTDKPFYTWTDADGTIRNSAKPDLVVEFSSTEIVYDAVFAPPFRLPEQVTNGACCIDYKDAFKQKLAVDGIASQKINSESIPYQTQQGFTPAGYFAIEGTENKIVFIKSYKLSESASFEVIALNSKFQPLHLASQLSGLFAEQTWKDLAYTKIMIEIADPEVAYLIVFANDDGISKERGYSLNLSLGASSD